MKNKLLILTAITLLLFGCTSRKLNNIDNNNLISQNNENQSQLDYRCYSYDDKECRTKEEKEIIKLIPSTAILREVQPIPSSDSNVFIGIYIENPIIADTNSDYLSCSDSKRGQTITGIYHLFTYHFQEISSDIIIPKSKSFDDYNNELSTQKIGMAWKNTKSNNFYYFNGKPYLKDEGNYLEISNLINFKDYNGDGYKHEFVLYGGEYWDCSTDENIIAGYDIDNNIAIIYKIFYETGNYIYWGVNFFPNEKGEVINRWPCGDHGSEEDTTVIYKYNPQDKFYYFVNKTVKKCN